MKTFIVDASTCLKWVLKDEIDSDNAEIILTDYLNGKIQLITPTLWLYEIGTGIRSAYVQKRINFAQAASFLQLFYEAKPHLFAMEYAAEAILLNCKTYQISFYESVYVVLALEQKRPFITADKKLAVQLAPLKSLIIPLAEYQS